ncbi:mucin-3A-like [Saccostrea cucullata]|uniref:mucin-3A-like n=1 Tax=Saccostrea cuccullata TaxID=36930 RepID=UPI002ED627DA
MTAIKKDLSVVANARSEELTIVVTKPPENLGPILFRDSNGLELPSRNFSEGTSIVLYCAGDAYLNSGIRWCIKREKDTTFAVIHDNTTTRSMSHNGYHYKQHSSLSLEVTSDDSNTEVLCESGYETLCGTGTANVTSSFMFYSSYETSTTNVDDTYSTFNGHATLNELTTESTPNEPSSLQNRYSSSPFTTEEFSSTDESLKSTNMFVQKFSNSSTESSNTIQMSSVKALTPDETDVLSTTASPDIRTEGFSTSTPPAYKTTAVPYSSTLLSKTISTDETTESIINRQSTLYMRENITDGTKNTTRSPLSGATLEFHSSEPFPTKISTEEMLTTDIEKTIKTSSFTNWETTVHVDNFTEITVDLENKTQNSVVYVETTTYNGTNSNTTSGSEPKLFDTTTEKISLNSKHAQTTENEYSTTDTFTQESAQISILKPNFQDGQSTQSVLHSTVNNGKKYTEITPSNNIEVFNSSVFSLLFLTTMPVDAKVPYRTDKSTLLTDSTNTKMFSSSVSSTAYSTSAISKPIQSTDSSGRTTEIDQTSTIPRRTQEIDRITSSFMPVTNTSALTAMVASAVSGDHKTSGINAPFTGRPTFQSNSVQPLTTSMTLTTRFRNGIQRKTPTVTSSIKTSKKTNPIHLIMTTSKTRRPRPNKHPIHQSTNFPRQTAKTRRPKQPNRTTNVPYGLMTSTAPSKTTDIPAKWRTIQLTVMTAMSVTVVVTMAIGLGLIWKAKLQIAAIKIKPSLVHV